MVHNHSLLQLAFDSLCALFDRVESKTNTKKTEAMVFLLGHIRKYLPVCGHLRAADGNLY